ncbi:hypothetical protein TNCV_1045721 [Trichonephila clavipes]|nr:hypothetical protein TNCV_1045721 [Trichonephila clavipes]
MVLTHIDISVYSSYICDGALRSFSTNPLGESLRPSFELFHSQSFQEETLICRLVSRYKRRRRRRRKKGSWVAERGEVMLGSHQSLPPTNLVRVDEGMTSPENVDHFFEGIESNLIFYQIPTNLACAYLKGHLTGRAKDWYEVLGYALVQGEKTDFDQLKQALNDERLEKMVGGGENDWRDNN